MFDRVEIKVKAGEGGRGSISFRHEKFVPFGGPDGGDGGKGGDVIVRAVASVDDLRGYKQRCFFKAGNGERGGGNKKHGRNGKDRVLLVPLGTVVGQRTEDGGRMLLADISRDGEEIVASRGGRGGRGNVRYASSTNQAPRIAQKGEPGEELTLTLEMRLIADVGIIGHPNAGKSTLLAVASAARPKVADYPFTTIEPVLGVVEAGQQRFVIAEIPGLIKEAHLGRGLGHDFLRHIMRTKVLVHLISGTAESPVSDMMIINTELAMFDPELARKPQVVALNKIDLPEVRDRLEEINRGFSGAGIRLHCISAFTGEGVDPLMGEVAGMLEKEVTPTPGTGLGEKVFRPQPQVSGVGIERVADGFVLIIPDLERIIVSDDVRPSEIRWQLNRQLERLGVNKKLEKAGVRPGDKIRCGSLEWEW